MSATHVALLRGVNVGGHTKIGMADLCNLVTKRGFDETRSLLNSGNVVFRSKARSATQLERLFEIETAKQLDLETAFMVRSSAELKAVIANNPFPNEAERDPGHLIVMFLKDAADPDDVKALQDAIRGPEVVRAYGRHAYIVYPDGVGTSRLTITLIEKKLRTRGTGRNWNTVLKLANLLAA